MSFNPDTPSTINRDWIYPSQPFNLPRTSARKFSSPYPRTTLFQNSLSPPHPPPPSNSTNSLSPPPPPPSNSTSPLRRRISHRHRIVKQESSIRDEIHDKSNDVAALSEDCPNPGNSSLG
ncbi:putative ion channel CASTOR [Capsicum annuum]